jgi:hypothetical protein
MKRFPERAQRQRVKVANQCLLTGLKQRSEITVAASAFDLGYVKTCPPEQRAELQTLISSQKPKGAVAGVLRFGAPVKVAGSLSQMVSIPTVLTGFARHLYGGALSDRTMIIGLIVPMVLGAIVGAVLGGMLAGIAPAALLKALLGLILIGTAIKVFLK